MVLFGCLILSVVYLELCSLCENAHHHRLGIVSIVSLSILLYFNLSVYRKGCKRGSVSYTGFGLVAAVGLGFRARDRGRGFEMECGLASDASGGFPTRLDTRTPPCAY